MTDGEGMERLWSYLRRFSRMTKEMRPSHRLDILSDALQYYMNKVSDGFSEYKPLERLFMYTCDYTGKALPVRISRAVARKDDALEVLSSIMSNFNGSDIMLQA